MSTFRIALVTLAAAGTAVAAAPAQALSIGPLPPAPLPAAFAAPTSGVGQFRAGPTSPLISCSGTAWSGSFTVTGVAIFTSSFTGCTFGAFGPAAVTSTGVWELRATSLVGASSTLTLTLPSITVKPTSLPSCTITFSAQGPAGSVTGVNTADLALTIALASLSYTATSGCLATATSGTNGSYTASRLIPNTNVF